MNNSRHHMIAKAAALPFRILESLHIACGYERSFKMSRGRLLANRYILGIDIAEITREQLLDACRQLNMPQNLMDEFMDGLPGANMVFFGFEDHAPSGAIYKMYLEYWDQLKQKLHSGAMFPKPHLLHKGFKWHINAPDKHMITCYQCLPEIEINEIQERIGNIYRDLPEAGGLDAIAGIISAAWQRRWEERYIYVEITEPGNPRKSFDLNLYPAGLRVTHIDEPVRNVATAMDVPMDKLNRLMSIIRNKFFGHISAGVSRTGEEYFTVYYEN